MISHLEKMRADLIELANDELGMDDYRTQLRRYQVLLLSIIDYLIEKEKFDG